MPTSSMQTNYYVTFEKKKLHAHANIPNFLPLEFSPQFNAAKIQPRNFSFQS